MVLWRSDLVRANPPPLFDRVRLRLEAKRFGVRTFWGKANNPVSPPEILIHKDEPSATCPESRRNHRTVPCRRTDGPEWGLDGERFTIYPIRTILPGNLSIPETRTNAVTFIGRLQVLKGVIELAQAIPLVLRRYPQTKFRFVGDSSVCMLGDVRNYLENFLLRRHAKSVEFAGFVPWRGAGGSRGNGHLRPSELLGELFQRLREAMAAGRGVVGSSSGGCPTCWLR